MTLNHLPADFVWGASTASYQVEGATEEDGRGPSIWDTFTARPGTIRDGHTGQVACDHYHRYEQDLDLMAEAGLTGYRFSIAWPRIQPTGRGEANIKGLDFYDRLVDGLLSRGIDPVPTLFHWDLPQALEDEGGWLNRDTAHRFAEYAAIAADRLGDRVRTWITLNEPFIHMVWGYGLGTHAPGRTLLLECLPVAHHQLLGHGLALRELRSRGLQVMISNNCTPVRPASSTRADHAAAQAYDNLHNRLFNDPILHGAYPDLTAFGAEATLDAWIQDGDLELISAPLDALGVNYYNPTRIQAPATPDGLPFEEARIEGCRRTAFDWPVVPDGLRELLVTLKNRYPTALPPVYITENGCSAEDVLTPDGEILDLDRVDYLETHLQAVDAAVAQGVDVRGYFVWTLLDNFEWAEGYHQRFGLVHVDHTTQVRTPKASFAWYRDLIRAQQGQGVSGEA
ncbi:GH1 family beta-glucosidase [Streptomyces californicus]|uniref:GH1 family beta-glucosidase n=1 Tax=Streptomyces californicus TaxID=67351 RepID=UPI0036FF9490